MKKLTLKVFFQKNKSNDCGPVCVQMVLNHFNITKKLDDLKKEMCFEVGGTYLYDNGLLVLNEGLNAELVTANPLLFKKEVLEKLKSEKSVFRHLTKLQRKLPKKKKALSIFKDYISQGGRVKIEIPNIRHITKALDRGKLIIALVYGGALGENEGGFHFVIVSGYKKDYVHINNPLRKSRQGWFPVDDFFYSLYSSTGVDVDNGSLLIIGK